MTLPHVSRPRCLSSLVIAGFALLVAARPLPAQKFEEQSEVVAVEVPVNVVGRDGEPVRGLTAADFEVYDGGQRQTVTHFEVIDLAALGAAPAAEPETGLSGTGRRHFLLLFDLSFSTPTAVLRARLAARDFLLNDLHPSDLAAVATFSLEQGPKLVITFTTDRAQLARAIDTLGMRRASDAGRTDPLRFLIDPGTQPAGAGADTSSDSAGLRAQRDQMVSEYLQAISMAAERSERIFEAGRISSYSRALADVAKTLNVVEGRKHVLFFSEGFDSRLMLGRPTTETDAETDNQNIMSGRSYNVDNDARYGNTSLQNDLNRMLEEFRRADCVIQAVDIGGLRASGDARERGRASGEEALFVLANGTGGELFKDANNLREPLGRVLAHTSVTYQLTFQRSDLKHDGAYHRLRVKANLPAGARLSHRSGYYAPRPFQELDPLERNLLAAQGIVDAVARKDVELNVLLAPFRASEQLAYVPVIIEVGGASLLAGHTKEKLNVEFYTYVSDGLGRMRDFFTQMVALELGKGRKAIAEGGVKYYGHFDLPPGEYLVRVLVRNNDTGRTGVQSVPLSVPAYSLAQPVLLPPFFMEDRQRWIMVREKTGDGQQASVVYPFTLAGEPYVPAARPVLSEGDKARLCLVAYNLGQGDVSLTSLVVGADGRASDGGRLANVERTPTGIQGLDKLVATFEPSGLGAGDYVLKVAVKDPTTGLERASSVAFHVVD